MAGNELVALVWLEHDGRRVAPGEAVPRDFPKADIAELREYHSIGTKADFEKARETAAVEANRQRILAEAEAAGLKVSR
jgi:hypothetical protein